MVKYQTNALYKQPVWQYQYVWFLANRTYQGHVNRCVTFDVEYVRNR